MSDQPIPSGLAIVVCDQIIEDKLNNRRRKTLGFKTPSEVFFASSN